MEVLKVIQGSQDWLDIRSTCNTASEAAAAKGKNKYVTRSALLAQKVSGIPEEIDSFKQKLFDRGHAAEFDGRPIAEEIIGSELYPVTGMKIVDGIRLLASLDGATLDGTIIFEHKLWEEKLAAQVRDGLLDEHYTVQMDQQLLVSGAEKCLFMASDGTREKMEWMWYESNQSKFDAIISTWKQFNIDLKNYRHVEVLPAATAAPILSLPSLSIQVIGEISLQSNLVPFGDRLTAFIEGIVKEPKTDQDFADADAAVKILQKAQDALEQAESSALAQTARIDEMRGTVKLYADLARNTRLQLEKLVKARKETIRIEIQQEAKTKVEAHIAALNEKIGNPYMPSIPVDFVGAMKAKKTISSLRDAVDTELADFKIKADAVCKTIMFNMTTLKEFASDHKFLFSDAAQIVLKAQDDCTSLIKVRINDHKESEAKRLEAEREKIAEEERIKAEAKIRAEAAAEKLAADNAARAKVEAESLAREQETRATAKKSADDAPTPILAQKGAERLLNPSQSYPFPKAVQLARVTIPKEEYEQLLADSEFLHCLQAAGVDSWEGYDEARAMQEAT